MSRIGKLGHRLYTGELAYDFTGRWKTWFVVSAMILVVAVGGFAIRGLNFSIEFRGGVDIQAPASNAGDQVAPVREAVIGTGIEAAASPIVTAVGGDRVRVQTETLSQEEGEAVRTAVARTLDVPVTDIAYSSIGPSWGKQISQKAIISLIVFVGLVVLVIWAYFREIKMSAAAIVALLHDLVITVGIYALVGFSVTPGTVIGVLTILGYSLYDTVVVFDKVRENTAGLKSGARATYSEAANLAVNQTLVRSINTTVTSLLPVAGILFVGAGLLNVSTLEDLALALFVGIAAGAYSSVFVATPLLALMKEREPDMQALSRRVRARRSASAVGEGRRTETEGAHQVLAEHLRVAGEGSSMPDAPAPGPSGPRRQPVRKPRSQRRGRPSS